MWRKTPAACIALKCRLTVPTILKGEVVTVDGELVTLNGDA